MLNDAFERLYIMHIHTYTDVSQVDCYIMTPLQNESVP